MATPSENHARSAEVSAPPIALVSTNRLRQDMAHGRVSRTGPVAEFGRDVAIWADLGLAGKRFAIARGDANADARIR